MKALGAWIATTTTIPKTAASIARSILFPYRRCQFGVGVGEYEGVVRVPRQVFRRFIDGAVTPERCVEAYHLHRTRFERITERKLRNRQLTEDGNVEITGRDLRALRDPVLTAPLSGRRELEWPQAPG